MNIGLLISEIEDQEVKRIIVGANQAANDKGITRVIMPGKYLPSDTSDKTYDYQWHAEIDEFACQLFYSYNNIKNGNRDRICIGCVKYHTKDYSCYKCYYELKRKTSKESVFFHHKHLRIRDMNQRLLYRSLH